MSRDTPNSAATDVIDLPSWHSSLIRMADFFMPVRIPRDEFEQVIVRIDKAVGEHAVALILHEDYPFRALEPLTSTAIDFSEIRFSEDPLEIIDGLDQLAYFAFERSSDETISAWASDYDPDLAGEATDRVGSMRRNMPELAWLWEAKSDSIIPPLVGIAFESTTIGGDESKLLNIYLSAARIRPGGEPDRSDATRIRAQLWPSDVRILIRDLTHMWDSHLANAPETRGEVDGGT